MVTYDILLQFWHTLFLWLSGSYIYENCTWHNSKGNFVYLAVILHLYIYCIYYLDVCAFFFWRSSSHKVKIKKRGVSYQGISSLVLFILPIFIPEARRSKWNFFLLPLSVSLQKEKALSQTLYSKLSLTPHFRANYKNLVLFFKGFGITKHSILSSSSVGTFVFACLSYHLFVWVSRKGSTSDIVSSHYVVAGNWT